MIRRVPDPTWADEDLVRQCRAGDQPAWAALVEKYKKLVYSIPARYQLPPEEAADVFQGVWLDLYRDLDRLERVAGLRAWLVTAAARRSMLHKKRRQRLMKSGDVDPQIPDGAPFVDQLFENVQREQKLRECIQKLPERCQRLVRMLFFEHPPRSYNDVARELGLAEGSIGFIRGRCLQKLRKEFQKQEE
jgi:RNA polymerase sigma factor (sigma-70 family)